MSTPKPNHRTSRPSTATTDPVVAVLWDMDGTLVDTEPYWFDAEHELVAARGDRPWNDDLATQLIGSDLLDSARFIREHAGVDMEPQAMVEYLVERVIERLREHLPWQPGARELLLATVAAGVPCGLVTMSWRPLADAVLEHLPSAFAVTVTGDEMADGTGKPHPAPYLAAADRLGVSAPSCVAIEDSVTGVRSALAANCRVLGVPNERVTLPEHPSLTIVESLTDITVDDLLALPPRTVTDTGD